VANEKNTVVKRAPLLLATDNDHLMISSDEQQEEQSLTITTLVPLSQYSERILFAFSSLAQGDDAILSSNLMLRL
jgi:hypothetical protein